MKRSDLLVITLAFLVSPALYAQTTITNGMNASAVLGQTDGYGRPLLDKGLVKDQQGPGGFFKPSYLTVDESRHRLFVSDLGSGRVLVFNLGINNQLEDMVADYVLGDSGLSVPPDPEGSMGPNPASPRGVVHDPVSNRLFVSDTINNRVLVYDVDTITSGESPTHVLGQSTFDTIGSAGARNRMSAPMGLAFDPSRRWLFVSDSNNKRVLIFDVDAVANGESAIHELGNPDVIGVTARTIWDPDGLAFDPVSSRLFVSCFPGRVLVFDVSTVTDGEAAVNVLGQVDFVDHTPIAGQATLLSPSGLSFDSARQRLFVSDMWRVLVFDAASIVNGEPATGLLGQQGWGDKVEDTRQNLMNRPTGHYFLPGSQLLLAADTLHNRVMVFDVQAVTNGENAVGVMGQTDAAGAPTFTKDKVRNASYERGLESPYGVASDKANQRVFVSDPFAGRILFYNLDSGNRFSSINPYFQLNVGGPESLLYDEGSRRLFAAIRSESMVLIYDYPQTGNPKRLGLGSGNPPGLGQDRMYWPQGLAYDPNGRRLFVADTGNNRVLVFDTTAITSGMNAIHVLGQPDFLTDDSNPVQNRMHMPEGLAYDPSRNYLFVADSANDRVLVYDVSSIENGENAIHVLGQPDFTSNTPRSGQNGLNSPSELSFDPNNKALFVADPANHRVLVFDVSEITDGENAMNVLGSGDFNSNPNFEKAAANNLNYPHKLSFNSESGQLAVVDLFNNRVVAFDVATPVHGPPDASPPSQPGNLTAAAVSPTQVNLAWSASTDDVRVVKYWVYRNDVHVATVTAPATSHNDSGLAAGTAYGYQVKAVDAAKNASPVASAGATTPSIPDTTAPSPPGDLTAAAVSPTRIDLTWSASTDDVGVTRYWVYRNGVHVATVTAPATGFASTGLALSTQYIHHVLALDAANNKSPSVNVTTTTPAIPDTVSPGPPGDLTAAAAGPHQIDLTWSASTDNIGVTRYWVFRNGIHAAIVTAPATSYSDTGLAAATTYGYEVKALDAANNVSAAAGASATTPPLPDTAAPSPPGDFTAAASGPHEVDLAWSASTDNLGVTKYWLFRDGVHVATVTAPATNYHDAGLAEATTYNYQVKALDAARNESAAAAAQAVTPSPDILPSVVSGEPRGFPNPWRPASGAPQVTLDRLPPDSQIRIYNLAGSLVKEIRVSGAGQALWDGRNDEGEEVASGVYFVFVDGAGREKGFKVVIQR